MRFFCLNDIKMRHLENRLLEKCQFLNLKLFHPGRRNFDQTDTRFLNTSISWMILYDWDFEIQDHLLFRSRPCLVCIGMYKYIICTNTHIYIYSYICLQVPKNTRNKWITLRYVPFLFLACKLLTVALPMLQLQSCHCTGLIGGLPATLVKESHCTLIVSFGKPNTVFRRLESSGIRSMLQC